MGHEATSGPGPESLRCDAAGAAATNIIEAEKSPLPAEEAALALARCVWDTAILLLQRRLHQPSGSVGRQVDFADGTRATVYRETAIDREPPTSPTVLVVSFRLRHVRGGFGHRLFRLESELNTVLFAGFPGMASKLWLAHDERQRYRGFYQWDGSDLAVAYVRALWWALAVVSERTSIHYAVLPGLDREAVLANPALVDLALRASPGGWWRPADPTECRG